MRGLALLLLALAATVACTAPDSGKAVKVLAETRCQTTAEGQVCTAIALPSQPRDVPHEGYLVTLEQPSVAERYVELLATFREPEDAASAAGRLYLSQEVAAHRATLAIAHSALAGRAARALGISSKELRKKVAKDLYVATNTIALEVSDEEAVKLLGLPDVARITPNYLVKLSASSPEPAIGAQDAWLLDAWGDPCSAAQTTCITGAGFVIGILDSGVDYRHPDLGGCLGQGCKVMGGWDFIHDDADPKDDVGHGTHIAAIAAGKGDANRDGQWGPGEWWGVAPDARILAYKVFGSQGLGRADHVLAAVDRALDPNQDGDLSDHVGVMLMSFGLPITSFDPISDAIANAADLGVVVVAAAGNDGPVPNTINSPGTSESVIAVGMTDEADQVARASSRGPVVFGGRAFVKPDLLAPGVGISAAAMGGSGHVVYTGTSMAAPHVAGLAALLKQAHPAWSAPQVRSAIRSVAWDTGQSPLAQGAGRADAATVLHFPVPPPVASLDALPVDLTGKVQITGRIQTADFEQYSLAYAPLSAFPYKSGDWPWRWLGTSHELPAGPVLYTFDTAAIPNGKYVLLLEVEDEGAHTIQEYGYLDVNKIQLVLPLTYEVRPGGVFVRLGFLDPPGIVARMQFSYGAGRNPGTWRQIPGPDWDITGLPAGTYTIRVTLPYQDGSVDEKRFAGYISPPRA